MTQILRVVLLWFGVGLAPTDQFIVGNRLTGTTAAAAGPAVFFSSGWENDGTGCSKASLQDGAADWGGFNEARYCVTPPKIEVVSDNVYAGAHAIRKHQYVGDIGDGGGFETILQKSFAPVQDWYLAYRVKYEGAYYWHADMKQIIAGDAAHSQDLYINTRPYYTCGGAGPNNSIGRLAVHLPTQDTLWESANVRLVPNKWHLIEAHFKGSSDSSSTNGMFEAWVDDVAVTWCGSTTAPNVRTGATRWGWFKWSTYTNDSGNRTFQAAMPMSYLLDNVRACTGARCGGS